MDDGSGTSEIVQQPKKAQIQSKNVSTRATGHAVLFVTELEELESINKSFHALKKHLDELTKQQEERIIVLRQKTKAVDAKDKIEIQDELKSDEQGDINDLLEIMTKEQEGEREVPTQKIVQSKEEYVKVEGFITRTDYLCHRCQFNMKACKNELINLQNEMNDQLYGETKSPLKEDEDRKM